MIDDGSADLDSRVPIAWLTAGFRNFQSGTIEQTCGPWLDDADGVRGLDVKSKAVRATGRAEDGIADARDFDFGIQQFTRRRNRSGWEENGKGQFLRGRQQRQRGPIRGHVADDSANRDGAHEVL